MQRIFKSLSLFMPLQDKKWYGMVVIKVEIFTRDLEMLLEMQVVLLCVIFACCS